MTTNLNQIKFNYRPHLLKFRFEAGTSRGSLTEKTSFLVSAFEADKEQVKGWGEAGPLPKLSEDDIPDFEHRLADLCQRLSGVVIPKDKSEIMAWVEVHISNELPSIRFAFETALLDLLHGGNKKILNNPFYDQGRAIPINGLIWMGNKAFMLEQIDKKLEEGFDCIKMKIGAIDFEQECAILDYIRGQYTSEQITIRVDANGAFKTHEALDKLQRLAAYKLHSIEQPIRQGQADEMKELCARTPLPIALDEELIGIHGLTAKRALLENIRPQYIILKPTLLGGIKASEEWIETAESLGIGWWITSALESNIGLNAIAQFTATREVQMPQGLGTGQLYHNNFTSPLTIEKGKLYYQKEKKWDQNV